MTNASSVSELVVRWQELRDRGQSASAEELCVDCPDLLDALKGQIQALLSMEHLLAATGSAPPADEAPAFPAGARLGGYRIDGRLGAGGMGIVLRAEDVRLGRAVALKVMRPALAASAAARQRFLREARAVAAVKHPHVVTIYQVGEDGGTPFLAMELLEGESLEARLARVGWLPAAEVLRLGRALAEGLAAAHQRGLIHRDVKPANVWLERGPTADDVKILDFGLARAATDDAHLTASGTIVGTPAYMAPEQALSQPLDARCDLFSLGAVLFRACTGQVPFWGAAPLATLVAVTSAQPRLPRQLRPEVPQALSDLVMELLEKDPANRPASAREVADRLAAIDLQPVMAPDPATTAELAPVPDEIRSKGRLFARRRLWIVAAVALVLVLSLGLFYRETLFSSRTPAETDAGGQSPPSQPPQKNSTRVITAANAARIAKMTELPREIREIAWGPAPGQVAFLVAESCIEVLDADTFKPLRTIGAGRRLLHFGFNPNGKAVAWCEDNTRAEIHSLGADGRVVIETGNAQPAVAFSPDGKLLATGGYGAGAKLWDAVSGQLVRALDGGPEGRREVAFSPDGRLVAVGNVNGPTQINEVATGKLLHVLPRIQSHEIKFSPGGKVLAIAYNNGSVGLWDVASGKLLQARATGAKRVFTLDWSPAGDVLATAGLKGTIALWDPRDLSVLKELPAPECVRRVRFSPDGSRLLSAGGAFVLRTNWMVQVWGLPSDGGK